MQLNMSDRLAYPHTTPFVMRYSNDTLMILEECKVSDGTPAYASLDWIMLKVVSEPTYSPNKAVYFIDRDGKETLRIYHQHGEPLGYSVCSAAQAMFIARHLENC